MRASRLALASLIAAAMAPAAEAQTARGPVPLLQLQRLFTGETDAPAIAQASADPVNLLPGLAAGSAPFTATSLLSAPLAAAVPRPRLRPANTPSSVIVARATPAAPLTIDRIITASVEPSTATAAPSAVTSPESAPAVRVVAPGAPNAAPAPVPAATPVVSAIAATPVALPPPAESDALLGDPEALYAPTLSAEPSAPQPQGIELPRQGTTPTAADALPRAAGNEPYQRLRQLQALQDQLAHGSVEALAAQRVLISAMDRAFAAADPKAWTDPRNALAAVGFVLSGGPPTILRTLATLDPKPPIDERLIGGVLAYAEGREADALSLLGPLEAASLPPSIAAQIAMAQSALVVKANPKVTMQLLAMARLLAPGTLVEEAAIRREIFVADQLRDDKAVQSLARQYLDRFRHSVYAGNFRDRFAAALSHMDFINDPAQFPRLDDMLASVEPAGRAELYMTIALSGVVAGRTNAANLASTRVIALAPAGTPSHNRARLYRAAALAVSAKTFDAAVADYALVDRTGLAASDQALFDAVGATIGAVRSATEVAVTPAVAPLVPDAPSALMTRAATAMKSIDLLLAAK